MRRSWTVEQRYDGKWAVHRVGASRAVSLHDNKESSQSRAERSSAGETTATWSSRMGTVA